MGYKICPAKKLKPNTSACKARLGCGLCGCAARPAPHIVKHTRGATQTSAHVENHTTHKEQEGARCARADNSTDGGGAEGAAPIGSVVFPFVCVVWRMCA